MQSLKMLLMVSTTVFVVRGHHARSVAKPLPPVKLRPGDRILSQAEAAKLRGVTRETLRRMSESGIGPRRIQLSPGRFGYLASDFLEI
jgi:predicted DNA-binding transcriptional regulator AlpA